MKAEPAMVLIAGDFVYHADSSVVKTSRIIASTVSDDRDIPAVAVLGNHDYSLSPKDDEINDVIAAYLSPSLEDLGVIVLENVFYSLTNDNGSSFHVIGLGSQWVGRSDISKPFSKIPANEPRVVFMHNPVVY